MTLYCATTNLGKIREFELAAGSGVWRFEPVLDVEPCEETGATFEENAILKAGHYSRHRTGPLFAEDSGLEVDALNGAPGIYSARFAGPQATDADNNRLLIEKLHAVEHRVARYVCAIALAEHGRSIATFRGEVEGVIIDEPRGSNGFGYDPHFFYPPFGCTFAEAPPERKLAVSHRGRAVVQMLVYAAARWPGGSPDIIET